MANPEDSSKSILPFDREFTSLMIELDSLLSNKDRDFSKRKELLKRSRGKLLTYQAYTNEWHEFNIAHLDIGTLKLVGPPEFLEKLLDDYLMQIDSWLAERQIFHESVVRPALDNAHKLSKELRTKVKSPTLFLLRGNTASGKTRATNTLDIFSGTSGHSGGILNPDTYKGRIKSEEAVDGKNQVNDDQVHVEGSILMRRILQALISSDQWSNLSLIIDKRFDKSSSLEEMLELAEKTKKRVNIVDVDVPLELSILRVLMRNPKGIDPRPLFDVLADGFRRIRSQRKRVIYFCLKRYAGVVDSYTLFSNLGGEPTPVLVIHKGQINSVLGDFPGGSFQDLTEEDLDKTDNLINTVVKTKITPDYISGVKAKYPFSDEQKKELDEILKMYQGMSLETAINKHSERIE